MYIYVYLYKTMLLIRGQPHLLNVYHSNITSLTKSLPGAL